MKPEPSLTGTPVSSEAGDHKNEAFVMDKSPPQFQEVENGLDRWQSNVKTTSKWEGEEGSGVSPQNATLCCGLFKKNWFLGERSYKKQLIHM